MPNGNYYGVYSGIVIDNKDPQGLGRIKIKFPFMSNDETGFWARLSMPMAGADKGMFFLPDIEDEVLVAFEEGDMARPFIIGVLWNSKDKPPAKNDDGKNNIKKIVSRSGHVISLDDKDGSEKIEIIDKSGKNSMLFDTANNTITIKSEQDIKLEAPKGVIKLSAKNIEMTSTEDTKVDAKNIQTHTSDDTQISAKGIEMSANASAKVNAKEGLNLESSGTTTIKGTLVNIN